MPVFFNSKTLAINSIGCPVSTRANFVLENGPEAGTEILAFHRANQPFRSNAEAANQRIQPCPFHIK
jgi:hypothetical protein